MNQIKNVLEPFAEWLQKSITDSYRQYLGRSGAQTRERLKEINAFFPERNIFEIENGDPNTVIAYLKRKIHRSERANNPDFVKYDTFHSSGIPKAIIGKNHYFKFLKQYFSSSTDYWIFQGSPDIYDITKALKNDHLRTWKVAAHKDKIKPGDKVVLWQTGNNAGCYALAKVTSEVGMIDEELDELQYYSSLPEKDGENKDDRVKIEITRNLVDNPVLWSKIKDRSAFSNFKAGNQGTNFSATEEEYKTLVEIASDKFEEKMEFHRENEISAKGNSDVPLNQILYGPPGTGKTYKLKEAFFPKYTLKEAAITPETFFEETVRDLTWWQVIALALLERGTSKVNELLENRWVAGKANLSESKNVRATLWGNLQMHTVHESTTVAYTQRQVPLIFDKNEDKSWGLLENELQEQFPELYDIQLSIDNFRVNTQKEIKHYIFTTFHQSFSYEDFVEGIKPTLNAEAESTELSYQIENGVFKELCIRAQSDPENRYAIFIDEINRGNVSAIFGELITLVEPDKRLGAENEIKVRLPYSKSDFGVPANIDIYATMNTADRSVEALDTALRRRFSFKEIMPDPALLRDIAFDNFTLEEVLRTINERIEFLLDRDHTIGHSYFMNVESGDTEALEAVFKNKVIPLLQEYFYHDYEKIALILGSGFVSVKTNHGIEFPRFEGIDEPDNVTLCELVVEIADIEEAVILLLNKNAQ